MTFPALSTTFGAALVSKSMSMVLDLLGWEHAQIGVKATDFASEFSALGITVKLQELHLGQFTLANKEGRDSKNHPDAYKDKATGQDHAP